MTKYDILEALNNVDDECLKKAKNTTMNKPKKVRSSGLKWGAIAACFCLMLGVPIMAVYQIQNRADPNIPGYPPIFNNNSDSQLTVEQGICVEGKLYLHDAELSEKATKENIGAVVGYISFDNKTKLDVYAYEYVPNDGKTSRVIISVKDSFFVYSFYSYMPEENTNWTIDLLMKASYVEILDVKNYGTANEIVYSKIFDLDDIIEFLSLLDEPHTQKELNQYYFNKFKNQFKEGEIWISESGGIATGENQTVGNKFSNLVNGESRMIVVVMDDNTYLTYHYFEGAGVIRLEDFGYGYILTEEQIEKINHLIGLD